MGIPPSLSFSSERTRLLMTADAGSVSREMVINVQWRSLRLLAVIMGREAGGWVSADERTHVLPLSSEISRCSDYLRYPLRLCYLSLKMMVAQINSENATYQIVLPASYLCGFRLFLMYIPTLNLPVHTYPYPKPTRPHLPLP